MLSELEAICEEWLLKSRKIFQRESAVESDTIACDCSGLLNLLLDRLNVPKPYRLDRPKAVHYYAILQEIGGQDISKIERGHLMAWRKDQLPKSGDTGHVLLAWGRPEKLSEYDYQLEVIDSTKAAGGLAKRLIRLRANDQGLLVGVRLHEQDTKVKQCSIYHYGGVFSETRNCFACALPKRVCMCGKIEAELRQTPPITILRHPGERKRTLSTVSLIKQRYPNILVKDGERFSPIRHKRLICLYPQTKSIVGSDSPKNEVALEGSDNQNELGSESQNHFILIDATWKKSKRMFHENPWLQSLPKFTLKPTEKSHYLIRKVPNEDSLSTLESFALVANDDSLIDLFQAFMQTQLKLMGEELYRQNYGHYVNFLQS